MTTRLALLALLAACGATSRTTDIGNGATSAAPPGPPPTVSWTGEAFTTERLPAISRDGDAIVYGYQGEDGARGQPNLTILVKDRTDAVVHTQDVLPITDEWTELPAPAQTVLDAANRYLADSNELRGWRPLAADDRLEITFDAGGHLVVRDGGAVVLEEDRREWLVEDYLMTPGYPEMCSNPASIAAAHVSAEHRIALLRITYAGNDSCWEPDSVVHVIAW